MKRVMIDLETLGQRPGAAILAIGAVEFRDGAIVGEFYMRVDLQSCLDAGLEMDAETVMWWMDQPEEARKEFVKSGAMLLGALCQFSLWLDPNCNKDEVEIWGNGASFDPVLLKVAFEKVRVGVPWRYFNERCFRTVKNLFPQVPKVEPRVKHHALEDARAQALHLMAIEAVMGRG